MSFVDETQKAGSDSAGAVAHRESDFADCDTTQYQALVAGTDTAHNGPASVGSTVSLPPLTSPGSDRSDNQRSVTSAIHIDYPQSDTNESSALLPQWSPTPPNLSGQASLYVDSPESSGLSRESLELLHYFKLHIGWVWVSKASPRRILVHTPHCHSLISPTRASPQKPFV